MVFIKGLDLVGRCFSKQEKQKTINFPSEIQIEIAKLIKEILELDENSVEDFYDLSIESLALPEIRRIEDLCDYKTINNDLVRNTVLKNLGNHIGQEIDSIRQYICYLYGGD